MNVPFFGPVMLPLVGLKLFTFQKGFNLSFAYLLISFHPFFLYHSRDQVSIFFFASRSCRRQFHLVSASPPGMWAMPVQIQAESRSIPGQLVPVRWSKSSSHREGRKRLLLFEAVGVIRWHEGRVLNQILLDADVSLFLSLVSRAILPCAAQRALHTPTCSCTFFYWTYEAVSLLTQTSRIMSQTCVYCATRCAVSVRWLLSLVFLNI